MPSSERLKAWWKDYEIVLPEKPVEPEEASPSPRPEPAVLDKPKRKLWTVERAPAAELIWGDGFVLPGGDEYFVELVKPLGLTPAMSVLDLSAGLGGGTRALTRKFGVRANGMEASERLAGLAMEKSTMADLAKKAPVRCYDPDGLELPKGKFDCIVAREAFYGVADKENLLDAVEKALKEKGQILFTDLVVRAAKLETAAMTAWRNAEPTPTWPSSADEYAALARRLGLDMRVSEDMTEKYRGLIMVGWARFMALLKERQIAPKTMLEVVEEAELWAHRIKAFESGGLRLFRFHLLKKKPAFMSNW